jgi:hypothetical protein
VSKSNAHGLEAILTSGLEAIHFQVKPATLLIPIDLVVFLCGGGVLQYPVIK